MPSAVRDAIGRKPWVRQIGKVRERFPPEEVKHGGLRKKCQMGKQLETIPNSLFQCNASLRKYKLDAMLELFIHPSMPLLYQECRKSASLSQVNPVKTMCA
jgi:hypothetical protein